jgi:hypothetical protein
VTLTNAEPLNEELVFNPSSGFHSARILETAGNFVVERDRRTLTASLVSDRDCTTLHFTVLGFDEPAEMGTESNAYYHLKEAATVRDDRGRDIAQHSRWHTGGMIRRRGDGTLMLDWQLKLERLAPDVRSVDLSFGGAAGDWNVQIPVMTSELAGTPARRIEASDAHHEIRLAATAIARTSGLTAIELEARVAPDVDDLPNRPKRYVQGIGTHGVQRLSDELLTLRDDQGGEHKERGGFWHMPGPPGRQMVGFPTLPGDARLAILEIPFLAIQERTDESLTLPVPSETDVRFEDCDAQIAVTRGTDANVRVEITPKDPEAARQILYFSRVEVVGGPAIGMTIQHCAGQPVVVETPDPRGSPTVTLRGPVLRLGGPWRLEIPLV